MAYKGFRERLHGHNYTVGVRLLGSNQIQHDGYVLDFGDVKTVTKKVCKSLNERFLCPTKSDVIDIQIVPSSNVVTTVTNNNNNNNKSNDNVATTTNKNGNSNSTEEKLSSAGNNENINDDGDEKSVVLTCEDDGAVFVMPLQDCAMLPIRHATVEELAVYVWSEILTGLGPSKLLDRNIHTMEIILAEAPGQEAVFRWSIPKSKSTNDNNDVKLNVIDFIATANDTPPKPCLPITDNSATQTQNTTTTTSSLINSSSNNVIHKKNSEDDDACKDCFDKYFRNTDTFFKQLEVLASAVNEKQQQQISRRSDRDDKSSSATTMEVDEKKNGAKKRRRTSTDDNNTTNGSSSSRRRRSSTPEEQEEGSSIIANITANDLLRMLKKHQQAQSPN